jgi:predicted DsbA family dithiol-disulfide isomerase
MPERVANLMVFIDVICPWCYVGKRRMERALAMIDANARIHVSWLPFELNPDMPKEGMERREYRMRKFGSWERSQAMDAQLAALGTQEGLEFRYDAIARTPNTFAAHRLIALARHNVGQDVIVEALFRAYFGEGRDIGNSDVLADIAASVGMDRTNVAAFLKSEEGAAEVRYNENAAHSAGISGVPAFILDGRPLLVGAHPPEIIASALRNALGLAPAA